MESLLTAIKNPLTRKLFGKRELKIIEKQLWGIKLTQSEKNRLSRDIRQKFQAIKELSNYSEPINLKKGALTKKIIRGIIEIIKKDELFHKIEEIILFGSFPENKMTFRSDIDIAVKFKEIQKEEILKFRLRILRYSNEKLDIQVYNTLPEKIKREIDSKGKILWKKE